MEIKLKHGRNLCIAICGSRKDTVFKNGEISWEKLVNKLSETHRTFESQSTYFQWKKTKQDEVKDIGGFVAGRLKEGRRKNGYVEARSIITLDIDFADSHFIEDLKITCDFAFCVYSTHKHKPSSPRLRLLIPLDRDVTPDEYEAIARMIASDYDMDCFDDTTYQPARLMYWPSTSKDAEYFFDYMDEPLLKADEVLARYPNWQDTSYWPESSRASSIRKSTADKQGDPLLKEGLIGAFCKAYSIHEAIDEFLGDIYKECSIPNRYTFVGGSTSAGLVVYDDKFAYSNHGTDPISGMLCNAFDLVRIHKFGNLDENSRPNAKPSELPSWVAMMEFVSIDQRTKLLMGNETLVRAKEEYKDLFEDDAIDNSVSEIEDIDTTWTQDLEVNKRGEYVGSINNVVIILENDYFFKGKLCLNIFNDRREVLGRLPWKKHTEIWEDADESRLRAYLEKVYAISAKGNIQDAVDNVFANQTFHPVKDYLLSLKWDGVPRLDSVIIDYIGADDTKANREITHKTLVAAVARIFNPGCKFDYMTTLVGRQGIGKSTLFKMLAGKWFSDTLIDVRGKESYEALDGVWIMEMSELNALKKADREAIKSYITKQEDIYRKAYARNTSINKRQCIFIGTTNEREFLSDPSGNRRFWIIEVDDSKRRFNVWKDLTQEVIDQIWAEAVHMFRKGENFMELSKETEQAMVQAQDDHTVENPFLGVVQEFIEMDIPADWYSKSIQEQISWMKATEDYRSELSKGNTVKRTKICALEIWCVAFEKDKASFTNQISRQINNCLDNSPNWVKATSLRFGEYGTQRGYTRVEE